MRFAQIQIQSTARNCARAIENAERILSVCVVYYKLCIFILLNPSHNGYGHELFLNIWRDLKSLSIIFDVFFFICDDDDDDAERVSVIFIYTALNQYYFQHT